MSIRAVEGIKEWNEDNIRDAVKEAAEAAGMKGGQVMYSMRVAVTGQPSTPGGAIEMAALLGKEECLERLRFSLALLNEER